MRSGVQIAPAGQRSRHPARGACSVALMLALCGGALPAGGAQDAGRPGQRPRWGPDAGAARAAGQPERSARPGPGGRTPFRPSPEDFGPLRPGEQQELVEFVRREMPHAFRLLNRLRQERPQVFRRQLGRLAPHVRHLRRIFEQDRALGRIIVRHSRNLLDLQRARRVLRRAVPDPRQRRRVLRAVRRRLAENVRLEAQAIERWIGLREQRRERDVQSRLVRLSRADALLLSAEPPEVRQAVKDLQDASGPEQQRCRERLRNLLARQVDGEIARLRQRLVRLRRNAPQEVDRRMRELAGVDGSRRGHEAGRAGHGVGRRGDQRRPRRRR